jgi:Tfp pilus assembly protein PilO
MGLSKLTSGHIALIGGLVALVLGGTFWMLGPYKTKQNLDALKQRSDAADTQLAKEIPNKKDLAKAKQEVAQVQAQFAVYDRTLMPQPPIDLTKPTDETAMTKAMIRLWRQPYELCTAANRFARAQARKDHVLLLSPPFSIPGQTTDPAAIPSPVIELPMGQIQVAGSFANVCAYARAWDHFNRVVAIDSFALSPGPAPAGGLPVLGTATVTCVIYPHAAPNAPTTGMPAGGAGGPGGNGLPPGYGGGPGRPGAPGGA